MKKLDRLEVVQAVNYVKRHIPSDAGITVSEPTYLTVVTTTKMYRDNLVNHFMQNHVGNAVYTRSDIIGNEVEYIITIFHEKVGHGWS